MMKKLMIALAAMSAMVAVAEPQTDKPQTGRPQRPPMAQRPQAMRSSTYAIESLLRAVRNPRMLEKLGLTAEQAEKLKALSAEVLSKDLLDRIRVASEKQSELMKAETIDEAAVMAAVDEVFEARKEMTKRQVKQLVEARKILTAEQISKAQEALRELRGFGDRPRALDGERRGGERGRRPERLRAKPEAEKTESKTESK